MTKEEFRKLTENILLLDGATGSNLMASGMPRGICTIFKLSNSAAFIMYFFGSIYKPHQMKFLKL